MNANFDKLLQVLKGKGVPLKSFQEYLNQIYPSSTDSVSVENPSHSEAESKISHSAVHQSLQRIGIQLLDEGRVTIPKLNQMVSTIAPGQDLRSALQIFLKEHLISVDEFLSVEKGNFTQVQDQKSLYRFRLNEEEKPEFYLSLSEEKSRYGNYQIIEELARGGMGIVYKAYHPGLNRMFALKVLIAGQDASENALKRFEREIKATAKLTHPNIVAIVDSGEQRTSSGSEHYFVMEFVEGKTLSQWIETEYSLKKGLFLIQQTLEALGYAHQKSIIHRDLKPENILVTKEGIPKITDFGLARDTTLDNRSQQLTQSGAILGSPAYMSPEQASGKGKELDEFSDIYSMGVCLYEILTKKRPFEEGSLHILLGQIIAKDPVPPTKIDAQIHQDLETIVLKSLEKQKEKRYPSALEFGKDLKRFLEGYPIQAKGANPLEKSIKWVKRNREKTIVSMLVLGFGFSFLLYLSWKKSNLMQEKFSETFTEARKELEQSLPLPNSPKKIQELLKVLNLLNQSLSIKPGNQEAEAIKWKTGQALIQLACDTQNYSLADYILTDLETLQSLDHKKQKELFQKVVTAKTKQLKIHQKRVAHWKEKLPKNKVTPKMRENALFEISKMPEEAIFEELLVVLEEGAAYFLKTPLDKQSNRQDEYYIIMVEVLGRLGNKRAGDKLKESLEAMALKLEKVEDKPAREVDYMVALADSMAYLNLSHLSETLYDVRWKMGQNNLFWKRTDWIYKELLQNHSFKKSTSKDPLFYGKRGFKKYAKGDLEGALEDFNLALELDPNYAKAYTNRGTVRFAMGELELALADFAEAIKLDPEVGQTYNNRGFVKISLKDFEGAILDFDEAIRRKPDYVNALYNRGVARLSLLDFKRALKDFNRSIQLNPNYSRAYNKRGESKASQKKWKEALEDYNKAIRLNPKFSEAFNNRGKIKEENGDVDGAILDYNKAIKLDPQSSKAYLDRGLLKYRNNDFSGSLLDFKEASTLDSKNTTIYFYQGNAYLKLEQKKKAFQDFRNFIKWTKGSNSADVLKKRQLVFQQFPKLKPNKN